MFITLYEFNKLIRVTSYLRRKGSKMVRVKSFQRKLNPLLKMPPGKIKLNKPDGHIGKEVVIDTDGSLRQALTELSDLPFVPKLISSKGDRVLIERPLITDDIPFDNFKVLASLYTRGFKSKNMDIRMSAEGYPIVLDPVKASDREIKEQLTELGSDFYADNPSLLYSEIAPLPRLNLDKEDYISPLELRYPKSTIRTENINGNEVKVAVDDDGQIVFDVNKSFDASDSLVKGSPVALTIRIRKLITEELKKQRENTLVWANASDNNPLKREKKKKLYKSWGLTENNYEDLYGVTDKNGNFYSDKISPEYLDQVKPILNTANTYFDQVPGQSIRELMEWY